MIKKFLVNYIIMLIWLNLKELGTGVGIGGLAVAKYTNAQKVIITDYKKEIL